MPVEETPASLPKHIHGNTEQADRHLHARDNNEGLADPSLHEPVICVVCKDEGEEILEDEKAGECFDGN